MQRRAGAWPQGEIGPAGILVAEDNAQLREFITDALAGVGYRVVPAEDGLKGIERFLEHGADLVLTDYQMPVMDGARLAIAVKALAPHVPVVMMSGAGDGRAPCQAVDRFIAKPFDLAQLKEMLDDLLACWLALRARGQRGPYALPR